MFELVSEYNQNAEIKVIGVGGGGAMLSYQCWNQK
ncbi:MAG: hypothetical protein Ct9H90mP18_02560 [Gammaproteobacteria bacterium]|nr:MAG: hypothetical protein Ct9H90mP18_02560 [Gammaproteobacteria bacterium]